MLIQRYDPVWAADPTPTESEKRGVRIRVLEPRREGRSLSATVEYVVNGRTWRHGPFTSYILDEAKLEALLMEHGLRLDRWLDDRATWLAAVPVAG